MKALWLPLALLGSVLPPLRAQDHRTPAITETAPLKNWALQLRTDAGFPSLTLRGTEVHPISAERIDIVDLNMTVFSGDAAAQVDTSVLSPAATYFPRENRVAGPGEVRLIDFRNNLDVTGEQWTYTYGPHEKKISLARNVRLVIHTPLSETIK